MKAVATPARGGAAPAGAEGADSRWRALRYFSFYRLVQSGVLTLLTFRGNLPEPFARQDDWLFALVAACWLLAAFLLHLGVEARRPGLDLQVFAHVGADIVAIALLMHASNGVESGLGMLLIVSVAAGSLLCEIRSALTLAAMGTLAVLAEEVHARLTRGFPGEDYTQTALLGAALFGAAMLSHVLAQRVRESEALAERRGIDLANLARLNEYIVDRMQSGILVLDAQGVVRLVNASAARLLGVPPTATGRRIEEVAPALAQVHARWQAGERLSAGPLRFPGAESELLVDLADIGRDRSAGCIAFLEDAAATRQRAQQLKLASLGRLTASIAHEVRNPLGAIAHAAQLLGEHPELPAEEQRLTRIIGEQSRRVNGIIETVLALGRRAAATPDSVRLAPWLGHFVLEFTAERGLPADTLRLHPVAPGLHVRIDAGQLRQVLVNLCDNALRHGRGQPRVELRAGESERLQRPWLDVIDHGPGIPPQDVQHVFEPFFTRAPGGTGLGLYIARELCEASQASLVLEDNGPAGCTFRIRFAHPDRRQMDAA